MSTDPRIKVIKLAERKRRAKARVKQARAAAQRPTQDEARDAADTVTGWVDELRRQKRPDANALSDFNNLFEDPA
jgi:alkanesulfonate monooxygenase SsuD/methylene tetrahydromethanopterin reductase-like flavin-dependent oxidoreductase (luciferase family)